MGCIIARIVTKLVYSNLWISSTTTNTDIHTACPYTTPCGASLVARSTNPREIAEPYAVASGRYTVADPSVFLTSPALG